MSKPSYEELRKQVQELKEKIKALEEENQILKKTEKSLQDSEERFRSVVHNTDAGYFFIDKNGIIRDVNNSWVKMYKYSAKDEIIGRHFKEIQKIDNIEKAMEFVDGVMRGNSDYVTGEFSRKCKDGSIGYHSFSAKPVLHRGKVIGIEGLIIDSTKRKRAEEQLQKSEDKYRSLYSSMKEGVCLHEIIYDDFTNPVDYRILDVNPMYEINTGLQREKVVGKKASELYGTGEPPYLQVYAKVAATGEPVSFETYFPPMDKHFTISAFSLDKGKFATIFFDITERKKIEEELRLNEEIFRLFMEHSPIYVFFKDENIRSLKLSKNYEKMIGKPLPELIGKNMDDLFPSEFAKSMVEDDKRILREKESITVREKLAGRTYDTIKFPITIDDKTHFLAGFTIDVTDQIKAQESLKESEEKYRTLFETMVQGVVYQDSQGFIISANPAAERILGLTFDQMQGKTSRDPRWKAIHEDGSDFPGDTHPSIVALKTGNKVKNVITGVYHPQEDEYRWININSIPKFRQGEDKPYQVCTTFEDITDRKMAMDALRKSEKNLSEAQRIAHLGSFEYDFRTDALFWSDEIFHIFGIAPDKFSRKLEDFLNVIHPEEREQVRRLREESLLKGGKGDFEHRIIRPDGSIRIIHELYETSFTEDGRPFYRTGTVQDITESKFIESILQESEKKYRSLFDKMANGLAYCRIIVDENNQPVDWIYLDVNDAFEKITHLKKDIIGKKVTEAIIGIKNDVPELFKIYGDVAMTGEEKRFEMYLNTLQIWFSVIAFSPQKGYFVAIFDDITDRKKVEEERKNLEEQLFQSQKMESIGRLAGGVAHDFNNILTGIMGYAELLQMQFGDRSTQEGQAVDIIIKGAERAADLIQQLLGFARGGKYNPVPLKINDVIKECIKVSEKIFEKNITVKYRLFENIDTIEADKNQMHQVLTNIIINARDAMPDGGEVLFSTENVFIDREYVNNHPEFKMGQYVKISISDTGIGMPKAVKNRIFEPFYTTKGRGKGTGLGLATVYGIIKNHTGYIHVYSEPGIGATFTIYLPVSGKEIIEERREQKVIKGDATVLIVDDEENIRLIAQKQLESLGYKVLVAGDGNEAITILKENSDKIDIVLLDMIMPNLGGKETYRELKKINPALKVVIISGFIQNGKASEILQMGAAGFIQKPFKLFELSKMISETLRT